MRGGEPRPIRRPARRGDVSQIRVVNGQFSSLSQARGHKRAPRVPIAASSKNVLHKERSRAAIRAREPKVTPARRASRRPPDSRAHRAPRGT